MIYHSSLSTPIDNRECFIIKQQSKNDARMNPDAPFILVPLRGKNYSRKYFIVSDKQFFPLSQEIMSQLIMHSYIFYLYNIDKYIHGKNCLWK